MYLKATSICLNGRNLKQLIIFTYVAFVQVTRILKILELNFAGSWRGGERQTLYNGEGFMAAGHQVALVCRKNSPLEARGRAAGFEVFSFKNIPQVIVFLLGSGRQFDIYHAQTSHILTWCLLTKPIHRRRIIFTRRIDFVPRGLVTRLKYRLADYRVGISQAVCRIVEQFSGLSAVLISDIAVPRVPDRQRAYAWLAEAGIDRSKKIIATTAALVQHKDPLTLVLAISLLSKRRDDFIFLHFGQGELDEVIRAKIIELRLEKIFILCGFLADVEDMFSVFDLFVMSSEEEGLGSSVLDAFMYRVPVVATVAGGLADLITADRALPCPVHDPEALAAGADFLLTNPATAMALTENAAIYVQQYHSAESVTRQYLELTGRLI